MMHFIKNVGELKEYLKTLPAEELLQIIEEAVQNENYYVETFGIDTEEQYANLIDKIYTNTAGCELAIKKEYLIEEDNNEQQINTTM